MAMDLSGIVRVGFLADTHSRKADGSDLPQQVLDAFAGCDLIVHLGDIGQKGILSRLAAVAPVLVPAGGEKGYLPLAGADAPVKTIAVGSQRLGLCFNIAQPDKAIVISHEDGSLDFGTKPFPDLMKRRFGGPVDFVAFGGTHRATEQTHEGVVFFNPGSPTLPSDRHDEDDLGSIAVLDAKAGAPKVELIRLRR
jgi:putative phosphoesterase